MSIPETPKIYHTVHVDRVRSILADGFLWSDGKMRGRSGVGTPIGLEALVTEIERLNIQSIAIPPLGSGLGGLNWMEVRARIENALGTLDEVDVRVYEPSGAPEAKKMVRNKEVPNMTPGRAALVELINRYLSGLLDPAVSLLEVHKLMYFMQEAGEPLRLKYEKGPYGPYATNLRHVLNHVEGHLISGYADGGDDPSKLLKLVPGAVEDASSFLSEDQKTRDRFDKVSRLVEGFETPFGLELLATVHWVAVNENAKTQDDIQNKTYQWSERKRQFTPRQIQVAAEALSEQGWIERPT